MQGFRFFAFQVMNRELKIVKSPAITNFLSNNLVIYRMFCILGGGETLKAYSLMKKLWNFLMVAIMFVASAGAFVACSKDDVGEDIPAEEIEKRRIESYGKTIDFTIARQMVDQLDFLFQASAYRDSLLNGGDTEVVIKRQFSKKYPQYSENGEICGWIYYSNMLYNITHNGISLDEDGAEWSVHVSSQYLPEGVKGEWTVSRKDGVYTLSGSMVHSEETGYFDSDLNVQFTTGRTVVLVHFDNVIEPKTTLRYCFDGEINATIDSYYVGQPDTKINLKLDGLSGYDVKTYHNGIPVFGPEVIYFKSGVVTASVTGEQPPLHFVVNFTPRGIMFPKI